MVGVDILTSMDGFSKACPYFPSLLPWTRAVHTDALKNLDVPLPKSPKRQLMAQVRSPSVMAPVAKFHTVIF